MTGAMRSTRRRFAASSGGRLATCSKTGYATPSVGIWNTATGVKACEPSTIAADWDWAADSNAEGNHPRRRNWIAASSVDARCQQAADADLQQADDLLSAVDADAGRHSR